MYSLPHQIGFAGAVTLRYLYVEPPSGELRSCEKKCRKWDCKPSSGNADTEGIHRPRSLTLETSLVPEFLTIHASALTHCAPSFNACERTGQLLFLMGSSVLPGTSLDQLLGIPPQCPRTYAAGLMPLALNHAPTGPLRFSRPGWRESK